MPKLVIQTLINAPLPTCFDLARDAAFHIETAKETEEKISSGRKDGLFEWGDEVVFEGRHLGVRQRLGAKITVMEAPHYFVDEMTTGIFRSLRQRHEFETLQNGQTQMTDTVEWKSPMGIFGVMADKVAVKSHLRRFIELCGQRIKAKAEGQTSTM